MSLSDGGGTSGDGPAHRRLSLLDAYRGWHADDADLTVPNPPRASPTAGWQFSYMWEAFTAFAFAAFLFVLSLCVLGSASGAVATTARLGAVLERMGVDPSWGATTILWCVVMPASMYVMLLRPTWLERLRESHDRRGRRARQ